jgi:genome maintenance exonuclease 1
MESLRNRYIIKPKGFEWSNKYPCYLSTEDTADAALSKLTGAGLIYRQTAPTGERFYECPVGSYGITNTYLNYPSITTILGSLPSEGLDAWRARVGEKAAAKISKDATERGTELHSHLEDILHNQEVDLNGCSAFMRQMVKSSAVYLDNINTVYQVESVLWSHALKVAGSVDCVADWKGKLSIIDFKTANKAKLKEYIYSYFLQTTAYALMFKEMYNVPVDDVVVMIAVEGSETQIFEAKVADYTEPLKEVIAQYHATPKKSAKGSSNYPSAADSTRTTIVG